MYVGIDMQVMQRLVQLFFEGSTAAGFRISLTVILVVSKANVPASDGAWNQRECRRGGLVSRYEPLLLFSHSEQQCGNFFVGRVIVKMFLPQGRESRYVKSSIHVG